MCLGLAAQEEGILTLVHTDCWTGGCPATCLARLLRWAGLTAQCRRSPTHCRDGHRRWRRITERPVRGTTTGESPDEGLEMTRRRRCKSGFAARICSRQESVKAGVPVTWAEKSGNLLLDLFNSPERFQDRRHEPGWCGGLCILLPGEEERKEQQRNVEDEACSGPERGCNARGRSRA